MAHSHETPMNIAELTANIGRDAAELNHMESRWRDRQQVLEDHGYMLRPRFHPEWIPSWVLQGGSPTSKEDFYRLPLRPNLIDAKRISDSKLVYIKRVKTGAPEIDIATYFSQEPHSQDPQNHCVPILDSFPDDVEDNVSYIVMPLLRPFDNPPFYFVHDVVDCVTQLLEGLVFLHEHRVAHRDAAARNIMMSAEGMFPRGHHPQLLRNLPDISGRAPFIQRLGAHPRVKYYYVDFGISTKFDPEQSTLVSGTAGQDRTVPELSQPNYDAFKVDIYIYGNLLRTELYEKYSNVKFLGPLIDSMTQNSPEERPSASEAWEHWSEIRKRVWWIQKAFRLSKIKEKAIVTFFLDIHAMFKLGTALSQRYLGKADS